MGRARNGYGIEEANNCTYTISFIIIQGRFYSLAKFEHLSHDQQRRIKQGNVAGWGGETDHAPEILVGSLECAFLLEKNVFGLSGARKVGEKGGTDIDELQNLRHQWVLRHEEHRPEGCRSLTQKAKMRRNGGTVRNVMTYFHIDVARLAVILR